jgi:hypothetical protein
MKVVNSHDTVIPKRLRFTAATARISSFFQRNWLFKIEKIVFEMRTSQKVMKLQLLVLFRSRAMTLKRITPRCMTPRRMMPPPKWRVATTSRLGE